METTGAQWYWANGILVLSNVAFLLPAFACLRAKKYLSALVFCYVGLASSIYHACKWGAEDTKGYGGACISNVSFEMMYAMDFFGSQLSIAVCVGFFINPKLPIVALQEYFRYDVKNHTKTQTAPQITIVNAASSQSSYHTPYPNQHNNTTHTLEITHPSPRLKSDRLDHIHQLQFNKLNSVRNSDDTGSLYDNIGRCAQFNYHNMSDSIKEHLTISMRPASEDIPISFAKDDSWSFVYPVGHRTTRMKVFRANEPSLQQCAVIDCEPKMWCTTCNVPVSTKTLGEGGYLSSPSSSSSSSLSTPTLTRSTQVPHHKKEHLMTTHNPKNKPKWHQVVCLYGQQYCRVDRETRKHLALAETGYILTHVFLIGMALKLVGPSIMNITIPLVLFNLCFGAIILIQSYLASPAAVGVATRLPWCIRPTKCWLGFDAFHSFWWNATVHHSTPSHYLPQTNAAARPTALYSEATGDGGGTGLRVAEPSVPIADSNIGGRMGHADTGGNTTIQSVLYTNVLSYKHVAIGLTLLVGMIAIFLFFTQGIQAKTDYFWTHSLWHILGGVGFYIFLEWVL